MSRSPSAGSAPADYAGTSTADAADDGNTFQPLEASAVPVTQLLSTLGIDAAADGSERLAATDSPRVSASQVQHPGSFLPTGTPNGIGFNTPGSALAPEDGGMRTAEGDDADRCNLYVSNISTDVDDDQLRAIFASYGNIVNSRIMVDIHTCKSRGFGFVQFSTAAEANAAVAAVDGSVHNAQTLMVRVASKKTRQPGSLLPKVFLRNVPAGVSEDELRRICGCFGEVTTCAVRPDVQHGVVTDKNTGGVSQVAYITFAALDSAKKAAASLNNSKPWDACTNPVLAKVLDNNQKRRDEPSSNGPSPGLASSNQGSLHATPQLNAYSPNGNQQRPTPGGLQHSQPPTPSPSVPMAPMMPGMSGMPGTMPPHPGMATGSPYVSPGLVPGGMQPQHPGMQPQHPGMQQQQHPGMPTYGGMPQYPMAPYAPVAGMPYAPMPTMQSPGIPGFAPGAANGGYPAAGMMPQGGVPPGYQVVMQPTLQPMYPGMHSAQQQPHPHQQQAPGMPGQFSPNFVPGPSASPPWPNQQPPTPQQNLSPGLMPQQ